MYFIFTLLTKSTPEFVVYSSEEETVDLRNIFILFYKTRLAIHMLLLAIGLLVPPASPKW